MNTDTDIDARDKMRKLCQTKAIDKVSARPIVLAQEVLDEIAAKYEGRPYRFYTTHYLEQLVCRTRTAQFGDWESQLHLRHSTCARMMILDFFCSSTLLSAFRTSSKKLSDGAIQVRFSNLVTAAEMYTLSSTVLSSAFLGDFFSASLLWFFGG